MCIIFMKFLLGSAYSKNPVRNRLTGLYIFRPTIYIQILFTTATKDSYLVKKWHCKAKPTQASFKEQKNKAIKKIIRRGARAFDIEYWTTKAYVSIGISKNPHIRNNITLFRTSSSKPPRLIWILRRINNSIRLLNRNRWWRRWLRSSPPLSDRRWLKSVVFNVLFFPFAIAMAHD